MTDIELLALHAPHYGVNVTGIFLEGASWSRDSHSLVEASPGVLYCPMPVILLSPKRIKKINGSTSIQFQGEARSYECPLYRTPGRQGSLTTAGHSTNFVTYVPLPSIDCDPSHWCKRGAALLCELGE